MIPVKTIEWVGDAQGCARLIDQTLLPNEVRYIDAVDIETMWEAIKVLRVRGAPAIGVAAAFGMAPRSSPPSSRRRASCSRPRGRRPSTCSGPSTA